MRLTPACLAMVNKQNTYEEDQHHRLLKTRHRTIDVCIYTVTVGIFAY